MSKREPEMSLKDILTKLAEEKESFSLCNANGSHTPASLLSELSESKLSTRSHYQTGLYIAEINALGYLGAVLYRVKRKELIGAEK
jgi:hypothetical protein